MSYSNAALSGTFIWPPFIYGETIVTCYAAGGQIESGDTDVYLSFDDNKIEQLTYGEIMVLSIFRVEHAIVVVEFYAIVFPLCKYISTPKSDRKSH